MYRLLSTIVKVFWKPGSCSSKDIDMYLAMWAVETHLLTYELLQPFTHAKPRKLLVLEELCWGRSWGDTNPSLASQSHLYGSVTRLTLELRETVVSKNLF